MASSKCEELGIPFDEVVYDKFPMNKSSDADTMEDSETVGICNGHDEGKIVELIADFEDIQDSFEEYECRLSVAAMVSDAVTNGIVKALLEESSEALAAKEAEILALNDKLEERDLKLWSLSEILRQKDKDLAMNIVENNSERERLVSDFMYYKDKMIQKLQDAEKLCLEKEKQLEAQTKSITQIASMFESEKHRMIAMEEQMKSLQDVEAANKRQISNLVQELNRVKSQHDSQNKLKMEDNMQRVQSSCMGQPVEKEEYEEQMFKHELGQYVCKSIYETHLLDIKDAIERDRLHSSTIILNAQKEMQNLKETLTEQSMQNETSSELQPSAIVGVLETSIQIAHHHISQLIEELGTKDGCISSLILMMSSLVQERENLESQMSSDNVIGGEIESNFSTLSFAVRNKANQSVQDPAQERTKAEDSISMLTGFEVQYDTFADRLREEQITLQQVEEKLVAEQQLEQGIEPDFVKEVDGSKGNQFMQLITNLNSKLEQKDLQIASYLENNVTLKAALNAERSEMLWLQERLNGLSFQIDSLSNISLQKLVSVFDTVSSKFLKMNLSADSFEETSKIFFEHIQSYLASLEEEFIEQQWEKNVEEEISGIVLIEFLEGLEDQFKEKELEDTASRVIRVRCDEGRLTLMNEIKILRQELELLKIDEPLKYPLAADGGNSNGFQYFSQLTQELKIGEATDAQKKDLATRRHSISHVSAYSSKADESCAAELSLEANDGQKKDLFLRRLSAGELSGDKSHLDDCSVSTATGKTVGDHSTKRPDPSWNVCESVESTDSPLTIMTKDQVIAHFKRVLAEQKRETECIVEDKTEEIYKLKRELLNKGMHLKKDKDLHALKKRIADVIRQLDKVVAENDKLSSHLVEDQDQNNALIFKLKDELHVEKRHLRGKVREKQYELKALSDKLTTALRTNTDHSLRESLLLNRIADLNSEKEAIQMMSMCEVDILITFFEETMEEKRIELNLILKEQDEIIKQNLSLENMVSEKDRILDLARREKDEHIKQIADLESERELIGIMNLYEVDILSTLVKETIKEKEIALNLILNEQDENIKQKLSLEKLMQEKDWPLDLAIGEKEELKKQISLLDSLIEEKKNTSGLAQSQLDKIEQLEKPKSSLDLALQLENIVKPEYDRIDSMRKEQEELKKQVLSLNEVIEQKEAALTMAMRELEQARKENISLEVVIQEKENIIEMSLKKEENQSKHFEAIITEKENALAVASKTLKEHEATLVSMQEILKHKDLCLQSALKDKEEGDKQRHVLQEDIYGFQAKYRNMQIQTEDAHRQYERDLSEFFTKNMDAALLLEGRAMEKAQEYVLRLEQIKQHMKKLQRQTGAYVQKNLYYKEQLEIKCRNLLKAEEEVDLLGDDIDALLILLKKVYMGLDHYLPVLQHYPGIADLVKLIKKELMARVDS